MSLSYALQMLHILGNFILFWQCLIEGIVHLNGLFSPNLKNRRLARVNIVWSKAEKNADMFRAIEACQCKK